MTDQVQNDIEEGTTAADSFSPGSQSGGPDEASKFSMIAKAIGAMHAMRKEDLVKWFDQQQAVFGPGKDYGVGDKSGSNQSMMNQSWPASFVGIKSTEEQQLRLFITCIFQTCSKNFLY